MLVVDLSLSLGRYIYVHTKAEAALPKAEAEASKAEAALQSSGRAELHNSWSGVQAGGGSMLFARRVVLASVLVARQALRWG